MEHVIMTQRYKGAAACNLRQKRKELIFEKYRRPNPKKEGVDL